MRLVVALFFAFHAGAAGAGEMFLRLQGSNTIGAKLAPALVEAWMRADGMRGITREERGAEERRVTATDGRGDRIVVDIHAHGSTTAFTALAAGQAELGMSSRPIKGKEVADLAALGNMHSPAAEHVIGLDGIAVIVHPQNRLATLDKATVARIFAGEIRDWAQAGGTAGPIRIYARDDKSGTWDTFKSLVLNELPLAPGAARFESSTELSDRVAQDPGAIGFIGLPYVRQAKALSISEKETAPLAPTAFTVATEDYALARRLYFYLPPNNPHPLARALAEYALSEGGQAVVAQEGFVSQTILAGAMQPAADAPEEYRQLTRGAQRLSLNFRFRAGSPSPDTKALRDAQRLAEFVRRPENMGRHLILCGFSDKEEVIALYSLDLSIQRADRIADLLLNQRVSPLRVRGYGNVVPVAANDNPLGRYKNRRVEVWIR